MAKGDKENQLVLDEAAEALCRCNKCGFCQTACKIYKTHLNEAYSARGRIRLIKSLADGSLPMDDEARDAINSCLLCQECSVTCPSGVKPHELVLTARRYMIKEEGLPVSKKIVLDILANPTKRKLAFKTARIVRNGLMKKVKGMDNFRGIDIHAQPIDAKGFLDQVPELNSIPDAQGRVGFFVGCFLNHTLSKTGHSIIKVLNKNRYDVVVPKRQVCCGVPQHAYGDYETAKKNARKNIELFSEMEAIITGCASCGAMLKKEYLHLFADEPEYLPQVEEFGKKVFDFSEFLVDKVKTVPGRLKPAHLKVTYHDGCHMSRGQGVTVQPREILKSIPRLEYVELKEADRCCGAAGLFQSYFYEFAQDISRQKVDNIEETAAEVVATGCPACLHRIQGSLNLAGKQQKVVHIADLLADAYE